MGKLRRQFMENGYERQDEQTKFGLGAIRTQDSGDVETKFASAEIFLIFRRQPSFSGNHPLPSKTPDAAQIRHARE